MKKKIIKALFIIGIAAALLSLFVLLIAYLISCGVNSGLEIQI